MRIAPHLGRILGIRLRVHPTWAIAFILIIAIVVTQFPATYPFWQRIVLGVAASLLFFITVSIREITLSFLAHSKSIPVKRITLFAFGGVSQITKEGTQPVLELLLAAAGLLSNLIIAGIFYAFYYGLEYTGNVIIEVLVQWLGFIFFMLAIFHFVPAFPLDGGRVLRALLWKTTHDYRRATIIASRIGWVIGIMMTIGGIIVVAFTQQWFVGILLAFPGLVLQNAATHSRKQTGQQSPGPHDDRADSQPDNFTAGSPQEFHQ